MIINLDVSQGSTSQLPEGEAQHEPRHKPYQDWYVTLSTNITCRGLTNPYRGRR